MSGPLRIVVAEDEAIIRLDLVELLGEEGYEVVGECGRGDEAIGLVDDLRPDLALLDIKMPGVSGIDAARAITARTSTAVVMLTAFSQRELIDEASDAGAMAYLVKPYRREDLVPAIELAVARRRELDGLEEAKAEVEVRFEERKVIDRAKGVLMDRAGISEADAFRQLQRAAMSGRATAGRRGFGAAFFQSSTLWTTSNASSSSSVGARGRGFAVSDAACDVRGSAGAGAPPLE